MPHGARDGRYALGVTAHARQAATEIVRTLQGAGHVAYFAGGCVRDELLGRTPSDYDVATDAVPDRVRSLFRKTAAVGASFGVILVKLHGEVVEVATFRSDGGYSDARRPDSVRFSTPEEDAQRRDFTVNALFLDPLDHAASPGGRIIDFVGGRADVDRRVLRAVGVPDQRLQEDHLRALRAVRLTGKLGFTLDPATADAIRRHATDLRGVSRERIGDEIRAILELPGRAASIALLHQLCLGPSVLDAGALVPGCPDLPEAPGSLPRLTSLPPDASVVVGLGAWCLDLVPGLLEAQVPALAKRFRGALCLSNGEHEGLEAGLVCRFILRGRWAELPIAQRKRVASRDSFEAGLALLRSEGAGPAGAVERDVEALQEDGIGLAPPPLVTGDDLVAAGFKPGPMFRSVLDRVYDAQLEGGVREKATALELARSMFV